LIQQTIEIGPIHTWLPGPMRLKLGMFGDQIRELETGFGFASRGIESRMLGKHYSEAQVIFSRIEPESALLLDRLYGEAVESAVGVEVGERVIWLREIASQLSELNFQLKYLSKIAFRLGVRILYHSILKHRETLLDLFELLSGSRYGYFYLLPGGARYDLTEGFQVRLEAWLGGFLQDHDRIRGLFCWTHRFHNRLSSMGAVLDGGEYGFVSRSAIESTRYGQVSHVESRLLFSLERCREISAKLEEMIRMNPEGSFRQALPESSPDTRVEETLETIRGSWSVELTLDRQHRIETFSVRTPSDQIKESIFPALEGESIEDLPLILESLSISVSEVDR
jgi:NADH:ubiquinone oxidoreductase subunit D